MHHTDTFVVISHNDDDDDNDNDNDDDDKNCKEISCNCGSRASLQECKVCGTSPLQY